MRVATIISVIFFLLHETSSFSVDSSGSVQKVKVTHEATGLSRRGFVSAAAIASVAVVLSPNVANAEEEVPEGGGVMLTKTPSGLKYIELKEGTGTMPRYGQLLSISYTAYIKLPDQKKQKFDGAEYLLKHGNGKVIAGLDEGLHTMKLGGVRRIIIPPKLGFAKSDLGPLPELPWNRWILNRGLDKMVKVRGGNLVFDVELRAIIEDEADQGYYEDGNIAPEDFERLRNNLQEKAMKAIAEGKQRNAPQV